MSAGGWNEKANLYNQLCKAVRDFMSSSSSVTQQKKITDLWDKAKKECSDDMIALKARVGVLISDLKAGSNRKKAGYLNYFARAASKATTVHKKDDTLSASEVEVVAVAKTPDDSVQTASGSKEPVGEPFASTIPPTPCPTQEKATSHIDEMTKKIEAYKAALDTGIVVSRNETIKTVNALTEARENTLKRRLSLKKDADRKRQARSSKKKKVEELMEKRPDIAEELACLVTREKIGRPTYSENSQLLEAIKEIAILGCASDDRRRSEIIRSVRTLDDLTDELKKDGFMLSRSAVYLRLLPLRHNTREGKNHITTVPVKLCRASNDKRAKNPDRWYAAKSMEHAEELASLFGPALSSFIGQDDKAHVPIGLTAANKQAPLLMSIKYKVQLPDHDFVIATKHKLTPTVLGLREICDAPVADRKAVKYTGPTYIQVKSLKHTPSNASVQVEALDQLLKTEEMCKLPNGSTKPILILTRDGADGPRYPSTRNTLISVFKDHNLDYIFCVCNAAGLSAYHFIERRMAPLSAALSGVVLPHDKFGSHLDDQGNTIDHELELRNFQKCGELLCELWNNVTIDNHPV